MISESELSANRHNAQLSTGPRTEEGKRHSSLDALRHGITGQLTAMTDDDRAAHDQFCAAMIKDLAPEGALEVQFAHRIATDSWRINRISAVEDNLFALGLSDPAEDIETEHPEVDAALRAAKVFTLEAKNLQLLSIYEQRLNRAVLKNLATLQDLQAKRKAEREAAIAQAKKLYQIDRSKDARNNGRHEMQPPAVRTTYEENGFVFSIAEIRAALDRDRSLERAEHLRFRHHKRQKLHTQAA